ncbi:hypothetical protein [Methylobacterium organophilum]|uniref:Transglycosylase SLT domain-containing protein n=1 Tax=Methylobacterium organophilum TaxID=410 RepID=A0ABQ4THJ2_METOR|nr:hypothetical protein [Methylobacterium organophilum]GJE29814.1 hypothetical protein LKMONMHP_4700 [Methylobacterium organophilum]
MALVDRIIGAESGGNATAKNPRSSATGAGQFIDGTWLAMIAKHRPDLAGLPRDEVLAMRNDAGLSKEMTQAYADDNGAVLRSAGFDPTPGNVYLAHFAGPGGAKAVLGADPSTPVSAVLPSSSIKANPFLTSMSAGDLTDWAARKVGGSAPAMSTPSTPAQPARFGFSGIETTPAAPAAAETTAAPAKDDGVDVSALLKGLLSEGGKLQQAAGSGSQAQAAPAPPQAPPVRAVPFDVAAYLSQLRR